MSLDPAHERNRSGCYADFTCTLTVNVIKIYDTGKDAKSVADDLKAALRKIEDCHQGSVAGYKISYRDNEVAEFGVEWNE